MATPHAQKLDTISEMIANLKRQKDVSARMRAAAEELREETENYVPTSTP